MKKLFKEFTAFIKRGNVLDLAVGLIIGGAFNAIVKSLVNDVLMPVIGLIGGKNVALAKWVIVDAVLDGTGVVTAPEVAILYGSFLQTIIDFLIIALTIFVIIKVATGMQKRAEMRAEQIRNKLRGEEVVEEVQAPEEVKVPEEPVVVKPTTEEILLEIRDLLKDNKTEK